MSLHNAETGYSIHVSNAFTYANAAARTGATGLVAADNGKIALQTDTTDYYILTDYTGPTWAKLTNQSGGGGPIVQIVTANSHTASLSTSSSSFTDAGFGVTITPTSSSNSVRIRIANINVTTTNGTGPIILTIFRGIGGVNLGGSTGGLAQLSLTTGQLLNCTLEVFDSPATTSATTYELYARSPGGNNVVTNPSDQGQGELWAFAEEII